MVDLSQLVKFLVQKVIFCNVYLRLGTKWRKKYSTDWDKLKLKCWNVCLPVSCQSTLDSELISFF